MINFRVITVASFFCAVAPAYAAEDFGLSKDPAGIRAVFNYLPASIGQSICTIVQTLLRDEHPTLQPHEREMIAAYTSKLNNCDFCCRSHTAIAAASTGIKTPDLDVKCIQTIISDPENADISDKMKKLLGVAKCVTLTPWQNDERLAVINAARAVGATDNEIGYAAAIAALFCNNNRLVLGFGAYTPAEGSGYYTDKAKIVAEKGYVRKD